MEVTRRNFFALLPEIEAAIDASDFVSIDGEFTGLSSNNAINPFDTPGECYHHFRNSSKDFLLVQFGLSTFRWDAESESYKHADFTFYLFPRPEMKSAPDKVFSCQSSSLDFLTKHKFDFNKLFYEGISYIDTIEESRLRDRITEKQLSEKEIKKLNHNSSNMQSSITIPENFQPQVDKICERVKKFLEDNTAKDVIVEHMNAFQRKIVHQELYTKFDKSIHVETKVLNNEKRQLIISRKMTEKEMAKKLEESHAKEWEEMEAAVGFSLIARKLSNSGKLIVGHCMILDLLHTLHDFFHPLPIAYSEFKSLTSHIFPSLLDTMFLAKTNTFKEMFLSFDLSSLFATVSKEPFKLPNIGIEKQGKLTGYSMDRKEFHLAGYDAFITGASLVSIFDYLKRTNPFHVYGIDDDRPFTNSKLLKPFSNKLFLYKTSFQASPCINLVGTDPNPSRDHVFHVVFPETWGRNDLVELFEPHGGAGFVAFIDDTSAYVSLKQHGQASFVTDSLCKPHPDYKVSPFWISKKAAFDKMNESNVDVSAPKTMKDYTFQVNTSQDIVTAGSKVTKRKHSSDDDTSKFVSRKKSDADLKRQTEIIAPVKSEKRKTKEKKSKEVVSKLDENPKKKEKKSKRTFDVSENWE